MFVRLEESTMRMLAFAALILVTACDGPRENAGENADFAAGVVNSAYMDSCRAACGL